jgi:uncharacterized membrane protein YwzB
MTKKAIIGILFGISIFAQSVSVRPVLAITLDDGLSGAAGVANYEPTPNLAATIGFLIKVALGLLGIIFLVLTLYAGFTWMTAMGDAKKVETAKATLARAVIGLAIVLSAYAISSFVVNMLETNPPIYNKDGKPET